MSEETSFNQIKEAINIAERIERLRDSCYTEKKDISHIEGALTCIYSDSIGKYEKLDRLSSILWIITREPNKDWSVAEAKRKILEYL